jgi:hypothetical protein
MMLNSKLIANVGSDRGAGFVKPSNCSITISPTKVGAKIIQSHPHSSKEKGAKHVALRLGT